MKCFIALSLISAVFALPQGQEAKKADKKETNFDGYNFRVGLAKSPSNENYVVSWVGGVSACNQRDNIGGGMTSWCDSGRWSSVPYANAEGGRIDIKFRCDSSDTKYEHVTYELKSGKKGSCATSQEFMPACPEVTTILNCVPN